MTLLYFATCANAAEARKIAKVLLEKKLVACANIVPKIESHYWWKGKLEKANETLLILKTKKELQKQVEKEIKSIHSYKLPVMDFFETKMNKEAEKWLEKETK